jgi:hypothetical protein
MLFPLLPQMFVTFARGVEPFPQSAREGPRAPETFDSSINAIVAKLRAGISGPAASYPVATGRLRTAWTGALGLGMAVCGLLMRSC